MKILCFWSENSSTPGVIEIFDSKEMEQELGPRTTYSYLQHVFPEFLYCTETGKMLHKNYGTFILLEI